MNSNVESPFECLNSLPTHEHHTGEYKVKRGKFVNGVFVEDTLDLSDIKVYVVNRNNCEGNIYQELVTFNFEDAKESFYNLKDNKENDDYIEVWQNGKNIGFYEYRNDIDDFKYIRY